jgi:hypothetical protein
VDYFHRFYEYIEEKVSGFLFVKSDSVIFFWHNLVATFAWAHAEGSHDSSYHMAHINVFFK